jgi:Mg2+/Co2+ transporter CorB
VNDLSPSLTFAALVLLLSCAALCSSVESSLFSLNRSRLRDLAQSGHRSAARLNALLSQPHRLRSTLAIGKLCSLTLASALITLLALYYAPQLERWTTVSALLLALLGLPFAISALQIRAQQQAERNALRLSLPLRILHWLLWPLTGPLGALRQALRKTTPGSQDSAASTASSRQSLLTSMLDLTQVTVNDIMIPRHEVVGINLESDLEEIISQLRSTTHTRLPVFRHDINQVEGILHMRQIARLLSHNQLTRETLATAAHEPYFVPESTPLSTQLINFQKENRHIGIVVDEYGEVLGIVTLENILEEIVGEFSNQDALLSPDIHPQSDGTQVIDGAAYIRDINRALGWQLPCGGPKTLNGLITEVLESIPDSPVCLKIGDYHLEILQATENRVKTVRVWQQGAPTL